MHESHVTFSLFLRPHPAPPQHALSMRCSRLTAAHVPIPTFLFFSHPLFFFFSSLPPQLPAFFDLQGPESPRLLCCHAQRCCATRQGRLKLTNTSHSRDPPNATTTTTTRLSTGLSRHGGSHGTARPASVDRRRSLW